MPRITVPPLEFEIVHRAPDSDRGPIVRVYSQTDSDHEVFRFDASARNASWTLFTGGAPETLAIEPGEEGLDAMFALLRGEIGTLARRANLALPDALPAEPLALLESVLRNPPVDLDAVSPAIKRPSLGEKWSTYPKEVLPLWVADMDFPIAEPIRRALVRAVDRSDIGYPVHPAPTDLPEITAARMRSRFGWSPDPALVEVLSDVVQGIFVALSQFSSEGESVIVQTPIYPPFMSSVRAMERRLITNPLEFSESGYRVDLAGLQACVESDTRLLLLCNPHNPSGRVLTRDELVGIAEVARANDLIVVCDEIHADLVFSGAQHIPFASISEDAASRSITLTAGSKAFNMAGLRTAVAIFGSAALKRRFNQLPRHLRGGIGTLGIEALRVAWLHAQPWLDDVVAYLETNRALVAAFVAEELPGVVHHPPEATYLAWLDCRALGLEPTPYRYFLERGGVALSEGAHFGDDGVGFTRINFATSRSLLYEGLERIAKSLR